MADLTITAANVGVAADSARVRVVQVGEAVTQGQPGYLSAGKYYQADADNTAATAAATGIFLTAAGIDGYAVFATGGSILIGATLTLGELYVVSATKGGIAPIGDLTSGDYTTVLGVASSTSALTLAPSASGVAKP